MESCLVLAHPRENGWIPPPNHSTLLQHHLQVLGSILNLSQALFYKILLSL